MSTNSLGIKALAGKDPFKLIESRALVTFVKILSNANKAEK
jgi:hypothetical protein